MEVKAPSYGFVVYRRERRQDPKIGDTCQAGQVMIDLVNLNALQARIYVLEKEASGLAKGKSVNIKLDALPNKEFHGTVRSVSPLASTLERDSPFKYFSSDVTIHDAQPYFRLIKPGMNLQARVIMEKYDSCFMVPASVLDFDEKEYKTYVYVKKGDGWEKREVKLGLGKHGQATILSGVYDKELIALQNPFQTRQLKLPDFSKASAVNQQRRGGPGGGDMMPPPPPPPGGGGGR
jgi:multidrug efflux pump subunit AcrA (membrane-fusion protein)